MSKEIIDNEEFFDKKVYDDYFDKNVRYKGNDYYIKNKISDFVNEDNVYSCKVSGTEVYDTKIVFDKDNENLIESASCTCPYYAKDNKYCKHIYALMLKAKCDSNCNILRKELEKEIKDIKDEVNTARMYLIKLGINTSNRDVKYYFEYLEGLSKKMDMFYDNLDKYKRDESTYIYMLESLGKEYSNLLKKTEEVAKEFPRILKAKKENKTNGLVSVLNGIANGINAFFSPFYELDDEKENERKNKLEEEMDAYGLEEHEKELVRDGLYDPWDFETEGPFEDDDYYGEDD